MATGFPFSCHDFSLRDFVSVASSTEACSFFFFSVHILNAKESFEAILICEKYFLINKNVVHNINHVDVVRD